MDGGDDPGDLLRGLDRDTVVRHMVAEYGGRRVMVNSNAGPVPAWVPPAMSDRKLSRDLEADKAAHQRAAEASDLRAKPKPKRGGRRGNTRRR